jgi:hypothetical protein
LFNDEIEIKKAQSVKITYNTVITDGLIPTYSENKYLSFPVYPNPSNGIFYIDIQQFNVKSWMLSDLNGRVLKTDNNSFVTGVIDLSELPNGIYILKVETTENQYFQKLIKQ